MLAVPLVGDRRAREPSDDIFESKLQRPVIRPAIVPRPALLDRLLRASDVPVVTIVAPPGYGKTTLLTQWADGKGARVAWLSADARDNDPRMLLAGAAAAIEQVERRGSDVVVPRLPHEVVAATGVPQLSRALSSLDGPVSLAIDHVELVHNAECLDAIAELAVHLPKGSQLALATRNDPPVPVSRLRAGGNIVEVGVPDLAMDAYEARALLEGAGVKAPDDVLSDVIERTEGWPVGLYLAALALQAGGHETGAGVAFSGDDRFMADYFRSELLANLDDAAVTFLTRTAVLERMCGPLCDALLGTSGSAGRLEFLERSNLLLVPLDRRRSWYRYHHLFRDLLRAELERREPDLVVELHHRAAVWMHANGLPELAMEHAQAARDDDRVAQLFGELTQPTFATGRIDTVVRWMRWFDECDVVNAHPAVAALGATVFADLGRPLDAERWSTAAQSAPADQVLPDGSTMRGVQAFLRARILAESSEQMRRDSEIGLMELAPTSRLRPTMLVTRAVADVFDGNYDDADRQLAHAIDVALAIEGFPAVSVAYAQRAFVAIDRGEWADAQEYTQRALDAVRSGHLEDYALSGLTYLACARLALHRGDLDDVRANVANVVRLRPLLTIALAHISAQILVELAQIYVALADAGGARAVLRDAADILRERPGLGRLPGQVTELEARLEAMRNVNVGASALTTAELRLVPHLATHLTFPEIGTRLNISRHTVKTQAISIYQKLGVSSRSEAIDRMHEIGLLGA